MKKLFIIATGAMFVLALSSCKKDYECECTDSGITYTYTLKESKKAAAYAACEGKGIGSIESNGQTIPNDNNCKIK